MKRIVLSIIMVIGFTMVFGQTNKLFKEIRGNYSFNELYYLDYKEWKKAIYAPGFGLGSYHHLNKYSSFEISIYEKQGFIIDNNSKFISLIVGDEAYYVYSIDHIEHRDGNPNIYDIVSGDLIFTLDITDNKPLFIMYHKYYYDEDIFKFKKVFVFHEKIY